MARIGQKVTTQFKSFKPFHRFPRYTASEGRYSGSPAILSRRQSRRIEGRSGQAVKNLRRRFERRRAQRRLNGVTEENG
ncbi:MAG TPA: hypothetical protein VGB09_03995, partial [Candidatus Binatia bacterium]